MSCLTANRAALELHRRAVLVAAGALAGCSAGGAFLVQAPILRIALEMAGWALFLIVVLAGRKKKDGLLSGFVFGLSWFGFSLHWVFWSMYVYGGVPAVLSVFFTFLFCLLLSLFPALAALVCGFFSSKTAKGLSFCALCVLSEWLRGRVLTGFPWASPGYAFLDSPFAGYAPVLGDLGVFFSVLLFLLCLFAAWSVRGNKRRSFAFTAFAALIVLGGLKLYETRFSEPYARVTVCVVQPDFEMVEDLSARLGKIESILKNVPRSDAVIFPESALPALWEAVPEEKKALYAAAAQKNSGVFFFNAFGLRGPGRFANTVAVIDASGKELFYDKHHLVPFGEYVPFGFRWFVDLLGIPMADLQAGSGTHTLYAGSHSFSLSLCYENLFSSEWFSDAGEGLPEALVNMTNLKWFVTPVAPMQHLEISRMRALESSRPLIYAANTLKSALIDEKGRVSAGPLDGTGMLRGYVRTQLGAPTPFVRLGSAPLLFVCLLILVFCFVLRRRQTL